MRRIVLCAVISTLSYVESVCQTRSVNPNDKNKYHRAGLALAAAVDCEAWAVLSIGSGSSVVPASIEAELTREMKGLGITLTPAPATARRLLPTAPSPGVQAVARSEAARRIVKEWGDQIAAALKQDRLTAAHYLLGLSIANIYTYTNRCQGASREDLDWVASFLRDHFLDLLTHEEFAYLPQSQFRKIEVFANEYLTKPPSAASCERLRSSLSEWESTFRAVLLSQ